MTPTPGVLLGKTSQGLATGANHQISSAERSPLFEPIGALAALSRSAAAAIPTPSKKQKDQAEHRELLQHTRADGQHRRFGDVLVVEDRVGERRGI
jgi:hypothetical protein